MNKHSRTFHLPWSCEVHSDDKLLKSVGAFVGCEVVVTEKRDGEHTSMYPNGQVHARSLDSSSHPWQSVIKSMWAERCNELPSGWRVVGENLYAQHSIRYDDLNEWLEVFAIFDESNTALSWDETVEWCHLLDLITVPVIWRGTWDETQIRNIGSTLNTDSQEGYVVRIAERIEFSNWTKQVGKWVRRGHVQTDTHWTQSWKPNSKRGSK